MQTPGLGAAPAAEWRVGPAGADRLAFPAMGLADTFQQIVDSLPDDWTDLELDLRIADESRYVDAAVYLATCNARPYSHHDWHWRLLVAHRFGHAASAPTVHGTLSLLDDAEHRGRAGRARGALRAGRGHADVGPPAVCARGFPPPAGAVAMARVLALVPDLLFGSRVQGALTAAGHEVELVVDESRPGAWATLADAPGVLVVDLADEDLDGAAFVEPSRRRAGSAANAHARLLFARGRACARARRAGGIRLGGAPLAHVPRRRGARAHGPLGTRKLSAGLRRGSAARIRARPPPPGRAE